MSADIKLPAVPQVIVIEPIDCAVFTKTYALNKSKYALLKKKLRVNASVFILLLASRLLRKMKNVIRNGL